MSLIHLIEDFNNCRAIMNDVILSKDNLRDYKGFAIANLVGGSIVIPHTRRAAEYWEALLEG